MTFLTFVETIKRVVIELSFALSAIIWKEKVVAIEPIDFAVYIQRIDVQILRVILGAKHKEVNDLPKESCQLISLEFLARLSLSLYQFSKS